MNQISISARLYLTAGGPASRFGSSREGFEQIHLRQGDMDGACGPYCLGMALITLGLMKRSELEDLSSLDGRTKKGKFFSKLYAFDPLINSGSDAVDLSWLVDSFQSEGLSVEMFSTSEGHDFASYSTKRELCKAVMKSIKSHDVPIVSLRWKGGAAHWVMVVGYQGFEDEEDGFVFTHFLCLDPGHEAPSSGLWNAVVHVFDDYGASVRSGRLPSEYWGSGEIEYCQIEDLLVLSLRS